MKSTISGFALCVLVCFWVADGELVLPRETKDSRPDRIIYEGSGGRRLQSENDNDGSAPTVPPSGDDDVNATPPDDYLSDMLMDDGPPGQGGMGEGFGDDLDPNGNPPFDPTNFKSTVIPDLNEPVCMYVDPQDEVNTLRQEEMREKVGEEKFKEECEEERKQGFPILDEFMPSEE